MKNVSAVRFLLPTAVAGAALLGSACVAAASVSAGTQPRPRQPFAIVLDHGYGGRPATVINMARRSVAGRIRTPVARSSFEWVAATGGHTFVLGDETQSLAWRFYKVTLAANGRPGPLRLLRVPAVHDDQIVGLAVTADASKLALAVESESYQPHPVFRIEVVTTATGASRSWSSAGGAPADLSWAGDRYVAFSWQDSARPRLSGIRLLDTSARGTSLRGARLVVAASVRFHRLGMPGFPVIAHDGGALFAVLADKAGTHEAVVRFSVPTGHPLALLTRPVAPGSLLCGVLRTDSSGQHLFTQCGTTQDQVTGIRSVPVRLYRVAGSPVPYSNTFAW